MNSLKIFSLVIAGAMVTVACGESKSMNPTAPSAVVVGAQSDEASAGDAVSTASGGPKQDKDKEKEKEKEKEKGKDQPTVPTPPTAPGNVTPPTNTTPPAPVTKKVEIEGVISAKGTSSITVNGQVITVAATAVIRHGDRQFKFADLRVGDRVHVKATRIQSASATSTTTTIVASEVKVQNPGDRDDDDDEDDDDDDDSGPTAKLLVSVTAPDATASETGPDPGMFRFTRSGGTTAALTVTFTLTGTATNGTDYQSVPLTVTFAAGQATANVVVMPLADTATEGLETVILTVVDGKGYAAGSPATATVTIAG